MSTIRDFYNGSGVKNNYNATAAPTVNDDINAGYSDGSTWVYNSTVYRCTENTATNALWIVMSSPVGHENRNLITHNYTIKDNDNAVGAGTITIADGATVTVPVGSRWVIV